MREADVSSQALQAHLQTQPHTRPEEWLLRAIQLLDLLSDQDRRLVRLVSAGMIRISAETYALKTATDAARETRTAAARYLEQPGEDAWDAVYRTATASFPFGPGEGCHAVTALGGHGASGSGCRSGIGWLWSLAQTVGIAQTQSWLSAALAPLVGPEETPALDDTVRAAAAWQGTTGETIHRLRIGDVLWSRRPLSGRFTAAECAGALPDGARLPTRWECLALLRAAGVEIVKGPWAVNLSGLRSLGLQPPPLSRIHDRTRSAWWARSLSTDEDLFVPYETQSHQHFTFTQARPQERAWLWPVWSTARPASPPDARFIDPRDGHAYRTVRIGEQTWLADSLRAVVAGSWPAAGPEQAGRYYTREAAAAACPPGCRLPTTAEWEAALRRFGNLSLDAHPTPAALYQAVVPGGRSGLDLHAQGCLDDWVLDLTPAELGFHPAADVGDVATFWSAEGEIVLSPAHAYLFDRAAHGSVLRPVRCVLQEDADSAHLARQEHQS